MSGMIREDAYIHRNVLIGVAIGAGSLLGMAHCRWQSLPITAANVYLDEISDFIAELLYAAHLSNHHELVMRRLHRVMVKEPAKIKSLLNNIFILSCEHATTLDDIAEHFADGVTQDKFSELDQSLVVDLLQTSVACLEFVMAAIDWPGQFSTKCDAYMRGTIQYGFPSYQQILKPIFDVLVIGPSHLPLQLPFYEPIKGRALMINMQNVDPLCPMALHDLLDFVENNLQLDCVIISNVEFERRKCNVLLDVLDLLRKHCHVAMLKIFTANYYQHREMMCAIYGKLRTMKNVRQLFMNCKGCPPPNEWYQYESSVYAAQMLIQERALRQRMPLLRPETEPLQPNQLQLVVYRPTT